MAMRNQYIYTFITQEAAMYRYPDNRMIAILKSAVQMPVSQIERTFFK
jgi:hypothetical protein